MCSVTSYGARAVKLLSARLHPRHLHSAAAGAMFGFTAAPAATGAGGPQPWDTQDAKLNEWIEAKLDLPCKMQLQTLDPAKRMSTVWSAYSRWERGIIQGNPSAYVQGIIRREQQSMGPYGSMPPPSSMMPAGSASMRPPCMPVPSTQTNGFAAQLRGVASPQQAPPQATSTPPWVTQAWAVQHRQAALFRSVSGAVPAEAMAMIRHLPGSWQTIAVQVMLLSPSHWSNPTQYMQWFADCFQRMPALSHAPSSSNSSVSGGSSSVGGYNFAVVLLGRASGLEMSALTMAMKVLSETGKHVVINELNCFTPDAPWKPLLEELLQSAAQAGAKVTSYNLEEAPMVLQGKANNWQAAGHRVLCIMTLPMAKDAMVSPIAVAPGYHGDTGGEFWNIMNSLRVLVPMLASLGVVVLQPKASGATVGSDNQFLDSTFGPSIGKVTSSLRVPQGEWLVRGAPYSESASAPSRQIKPFPAALNLDSRLAAAADEREPYSAVMPPLNTLEEICEKAASNEPLNDEEKAMFGLATFGGTSTTAAGSDQHRLLDRNALATIFGIDGWRVLDHWEAKLPCARTIHPMTGQPAEGAGCVECGRGLYCPNCANYYDCLVASPSPYLIFDGAAKIMQAMLSEPGQHSRPAMGTSGLPPHHVCTQPCTGCL